MLLEIQHQGMAIKLRLSDMWMRDEYQMLPRRMHPNTKMSQNNGFLLSSGGGGGGIKLCPITGHSEIDQDILKEMHLKVGGRQGQNPKHEEKNDNSGKKSNNEDSAEET